MERVHATCVEIEGGGVLISGPPGAGKSDLALRLIDAGAVLVADDYTDVEGHGDRLLASAPPSTAGLLEVRGLGVYRVPSTAATEVRLSVRLIAPEEIERMPERATRIINGVAVAALDLAAFEVSAVAKVRLAARELLGIVSRVSD